MNINKLILIIKKKLNDKLIIENLKIEDKSFLHKNHVNNQKDKFHLKLIIISDELSKLSKIDSNKKIYKILELEMKKYIHSIQILIR
jgi:BolA family transcriptional regulator, general stress-responsive regulator